jgi:elongation factor G
VFLGSAFKNVCVQPLLDGVVDYLPNPAEVVNHALDLENGEKQVVLSPSTKGDFLSLAFKLEDTKFGQLTYLRVYQGTAKRGGFITNVRTGKRTKLGKIVRMHANEMEEVSELPSGEIGAMFGVDCASGDTFTDGTCQIAMTSMFVPEPVISLAIRPKAKDVASFSKALQRFQKEDPTFRVHVDHESKEVWAGSGIVLCDLWI